MGRIRGGRNAAKEKVWPGQDAATARAFKRSQETVAQTEEHDALNRTFSGGRSRRVEDAGSIPADLATFDDEELPEYEGDDLPMLQPVTGGTLRLQPRETLADSEKCEVILAAPDLTLDRAMQPLHTTSHIPPSKRRRAKRLDLFRVVRPAGIPQLPRKLPVWIGQDVPPNKQARDQIRAVSKKKRVLAIVRELSLNKMDAFIRICRMGTSIEYALPELFYKGDPCRAYLFVESIDFAKFVAAVTA